MDWTYVSVFLTIAVVHGLAVVSPGPDFAIVLRNTLVHGRRTGLRTAAGVATGILLHVTYSVLGFAVVVAQSVTLFTLLKWAGAAYLLYIGVMSLRARPAPATPFPADTDTDTPSSPARRPEPSLFAAVRSGLVVNALNPKVTLYFLSLYTLVVPPHTPLAIQIGYGLYMAVATLAWFSLLAVLVSHHRIKERLVRIQHRIEQAFGGLLILLGLKLAFTEARG